MIRENRDSVHRFGGRDVLYRFCAITLILIAVPVGHGTAADAGVRTAYLGEEILLQGINTDSDVTYLFITGPNLPAAGGRLEDPHMAVIDGDPASFTRTDVGAGNQWQYRWQTAGIGIDAGTYTVYAEGFPRNRDHVDSASSSASTFVLVGPAGTSPVISTVTAMLTPVSPPTSPSTLPPAPSLSTPVATTAPPATGFSSAIPVAALLGACFLFLRR